MRNLVVIYSFLWLFSSIDTHMRYKNSILLITVITLTTYFWPLSYSRCGFSYGNNNGTRNDLIVILSYYSDNMAAYVSVPLQCGFHMVILNNSIYESFKIYTNIAYHDALDLNSLGIHFSKAALNTLFSSMGGHMMHQMRFFTQIFTLSIFIMVYLDCICSYFR